MLGKLSLLAKIDNQRVLLFRLSTCPLYFFLRIVKLLRQGSGLCFKFAQLKPLLAMLYLKLCILLLFTNQPLVERLYFITFNLKFTLLCLQVLPKLLQFSVRLALWVAFLTKEIFVLVYRLLHLFHLFGLVSFLAPFTFDVIFVLLDQPLFLLNHDVFLMNNAL